jgi:hypothetical protein
MFILKWKEIHITTEIVYNAKYIIVGFCTKPFLITREGDYFYGLNHYWWNEISEWVSFCWRLSVYADTGNAALLLDTLTVLQRRHVKYRKNSRWDLDWVRDEFVSYEHKKHYDLIRNLMHNIHLKVARVFTDWEAL